MAKNISITIGYDDGAGTWQPLQGKKVYLRPSRTDIHVLRSGVWVPWEGNPDNDAGYKDCIQVQTNGSGVATFQAVPYTDTEVQLPLDASGAELLPDVQWNLIDPNAQGGIKVYYGPLPSSLGTGAVSTKDLITLAAPDTWKIAGTAWSAYPEGNAFVGSVTLATGTDEATINFIPGAFSTPPRMLFGSCADKNGSVIAVGVKQNSSGVLQLTTTTCTVKASSQPASSVTIWYRAEGT